VSFKVPTDIARLSDAELADLIAEGTAEFESLLAMEAPSDPDVIEAERISPLLTQLDAEQKRREAANAGRVERMNAVREAHAAEPREPEPADPGDGDSGSDAEPPAPPAVIAEPSPTVHQEDLVQAADESDEAFARRKGRYPAMQAPGVGVGASATASNGSVTVTSNSGTEVEVLPKRNIADIAQRTGRPERPASNSGGVTIIASADVPEFATGSKVESLLDVAKMAINRMKGFPQPVGQQGGQMHQYGLCSFRTEFPDDLIAHNTEDDYNVLQHAIDERRLPGGSLTAAGQGWCAPSEVLLSMCEGETTDGMVSIPEVQVRRGGIKFTKGPDFSAIYSGSGFCQTEAQAISGTTKPCYEVPCPSFTEVRLDACGVCVKVPILLNAAWPELVQRVIRGVLIAFQHQINAKVLAAMATALGAAAVVTGKGSTTIDTLNALEVVGDSIRTKYRLGLSQTMEVVAPFWLQGAIQADLAARTGGNANASDTDVNAMFAARGLSPQWVVDWQDLATTCTTAYPTTANVMVYPAGTFIKGTADVINLNAVYDAASLSTNYFTGLFMEQGILIANPCWSGCLVTVPICNAGRTGAHDLTCP
jgi:hypothetical protein